MAKILRALQKVFGDSVVATDNIAQFGSLKAGAPLFSKDPSIIQGLNAYLEGWKSAVVNNNAPALQDENALHYLWSRQLAYLFQAGIPEYDTATEYHLGSFVQDAGVVYRSIQNTNLNNALTDAAWWEPVLATIKPATVSSSTSGVVGTSNQAARRDHSHDLGTHAHTDSTNGGTISVLGASGDTTMKTLHGYGRIVSPTQTASAAGNEVIDCSLKHVALKTGGTATITLSNLAEGQTFTLVVNSTGSAYTITWSPTVKWAAKVVPTPSPIANVKDIYTFIKIGGDILGTAVKSVG